jgi:hypothetical protein
MDFTPDDMEAARIALEGIDGHIPVAVEPSAAVLLDAQSGAHPLPISLPSWNGPPTGSGSSWDVGSLLPRVERMR